MAGTVSGAGVRAARACRVLVLVVALAAPASPQSFLELLAQVFEDLPALGRAIHTAVKPENSRLQARSGLGESPSADRYCFGDLGCLVTGRDFHHPRYRALNLEPETREVINVTFTVRSKEDPRGVVVPGLDVQRVLRSSFNPARETKVLIHGYLNGRDMPWILDIVSALSSAGDFNVVVVDWTDGSIALYSQAVANARVVGLEVAHFVNWLRDQTGLDPRDVHLIGHSLGAHICGYAGERINGLGRITGLDPAEPYFQHLPTTVRLDPSDALLVDVIHTDASPFSLDGGYGMRQPAGHLDFYPNDGQHQPGCQPPAAAPLRWLVNGKNFSKAWHAVEDALGCNHIRAARLFADSIVSPCPYLAFRCDSYQRFRDGKCFSCGEAGSGCVPMGLHANTWSGRGQPGVKLFLSTGNEQQLCMYHYRLRMKLGQLGDAPSGGMGIVNITLLTNTGRSAHFDLTAGLPRTFSSKKMYTFLLEHGEDLSSSEAAVVTWTCGRACRGDGLPLSSLSLLNVENFFLRKTKAARSLGGSGEVVLCPDPGGPGVVLASSEKTVRLVASPACAKDRPSGALPRPGART